MTSRKRKTPPTGGARPTKLAGGVGGQRKIFNCSNAHISRLRRKLKHAGLALSSSRTDTQIECLLKILQYLGESGLSTPEGTGIGFARLATRVFDLELKGWRIDTLREDVITADGLKHKGIARYVFRGRRLDMPDPQGNLDLD
ncbi:helix-turn-helix domain-containing protein [Pseudoduganella sp. UC29_106]|uniref:helix-turn-helix domain-containing protein n=1 Tax=Pseudoduganella sp. UC29_106 TaxID=3374553 RepID=UPI003756FE53